ncbi:hypothetical protein ACFL17_00225 [Pseudomonadota bacterium]
MTPLSRNVERLAHLDLPGGGQVIVKNGYAYVGHMKPPFGTSIIDVSNPKNPQVVAEIKLDDEYSHTHKVRVIGDLMITNVEQNNRHFLRRAEKIPGALEKLEKSLGRSPRDSELASELTVTESDIQILKSALKRGYHDGGFKLYDISNRTQPKLIHYEKTFGCGTHRFDADENYAYISTEMPGFSGNILVNYDIKNPSHPIEVSRWWLPGQHLAGGEQPTWEGHNNRLHHAMRVGDELWAAVWHAGFRVLDVSNIREPITAASYDYHPPFPEPTHTIMPLEHKINGRRIAVIRSSSLRSPG